MDTRTSDRAELRRQAAWHKENELHLALAVRGLLKTYEGRRYLFWLLQISKAIGVVPFGDNALKTSFACGEQNVGVQVLQHILNVDPEGLFQVLRDEHGRARELEQRAAAASGGDSEPGDDDSAD